MLKDFNDRSGGLPHRVEVAVVGAGPIGLMTANLLGLAGVRVAVLERNRGLLGLPRAIAYDAETLRLFAQVGLFGEIAPGLVQDPHVRHVNARNVTLMAADFPRGLYGHSSLGTFYQPDFESALLKGLSRFDNVRVAFEHAVADLTQDGDRRRLEDRRARGRTHAQRRLRRRLRRRHERRPGAARAQARGLDLRRALAGDRCDRQGPQGQGDHLQLRSASSIGPIAGRRRPRPLGIHAIAGRERRRAEERRQRSRSDQAEVGNRRLRSRAQGRLHLPRARRRSLARRAGLPGGRRGASDAAVRRPGHERRHEGRGQSVLEARRGPERRGEGRHSRHLRDRARADRPQDGRGLAPPRVDHHADEPDRRRDARLPLCLPQPVEPVPRLHRAWRRRAAAGHRPQRPHRGGARRAGRPDDAATDRRDGAVASASR